MSCSHKPTGPTTQAGEDVLRRCEICRQTIKRKIEPWELVDEGVAELSARAHAAYESKSEESLARSEGTNSHYGGLYKAHELGKDAARKILEDS